MSFIETIDSLPSSSVLTLPDCHIAIQDLRNDLNRRIVGQSALVDGVVMTLLLGGHALLEGNPGDGKTTCVQKMAALTGLAFRRIQFRPDMMPGDLIGKHFLQQTPTSQQRPENVDGGVKSVELRWRPGPLFSPIVVADEINRASPKVQAATLEAMQERRITRVDKLGPCIIYPREYRRTLKQLHGTGPPEPCYGVPLPKVTDFDRACFSVFATQNPLEMEGVYPLSEAQLDRFTFMFIVRPVRPDSYGDVLTLNLPATLSMATAPDGENPAGLKDELPRWLKVICFWDWIRNALFNREQSVLTQLIANQPGLWDRVRLAILMSHYRRASASHDMEHDTTASVSEHAWVKDEIRKLCTGLGKSESLARDSVRQAIAELMDNDAFQHVVVGSSPRGLIDWPRAAVAHAFLRSPSKGLSDASKVKVCRKDFAAVAPDVLRHRIRLSPFARAVGVETSHLIDSLVRQIFPTDAEQEDAEDAKPLFP